MLKTRSIIHKKMRILLANSTLALLAGTETATATLARELKRQGHDVACFAPQLGVVSDSLERDGIRCVDSLNRAKPFSIVLEPEFNADFDLILSNHHEITTYLRERFPETFIVSTVHGVIHRIRDEQGQEMIAPEHPAVGKADRFVAVSEEVKNVLFEQYGIEAEIIRNSFDLSRFRTERKPAQPKPKQFLINTNYATRDDDEVKIIKAVADHYGAKLAAVGQNFVMTEDISKAIEDSDIVVGMGRSVLEGVAMGRLGIVHGRWGTGGIVSPDSVETLRKCNFSGRNSGGDFWTVERFIKEIDSLYTEDSLDWGQAYVASDHDIKDQAEKYLSLAGKREQPIEEAPVKKAKFQSGNYA